jgi:hypothetical protein
MPVRHEERAMKAKLSDAFAKKALPGIYFDSDPKALRGFMLRVTAAGSRAWCLNYRVKDSGRERRITIGDVVAWPIAKARKRAAEMRREIDAGADPFYPAETRPLPNGLIDVLGAIQAKLNSAMIGVRIAEKMVTEADKAIERLARRIELTASK